MRNQVGQELLQIPFPEMVKNLALAIAEGQTALDKNSIEITKELAEETIDLPGMPRPLTIPNPTFDPTQPPGPGNLQTIDNPDKDKPVDPVTFPLIALGISPTFYQFQEGIIEVKMAITMAISTDLSVDVKGKVERKGKRLAFSASVDARYSRKYDYKAEGASRLQLKIAPVPPAKAMQDYIEAFIQAQQQRTLPPAPA